MPSYYQKLTDLRLLFHKKGEGRAQYQILARDVLRALASHDRPSQPTILDHSSTTSPFYTKKIRWTDSLSQYKVWPIIDPLRRALTGDPAAMRDFLKNGFPALRHYREEFRKARADETDPRLDHSNTAALNQIEAQLEAAIQAVLRIFPEVKNLRETVAGADGYGYIQNLTKMLSDYQDEREQRPGLHFFGFASDPKLPGIHRAAAVDSLQQALLHFAHRRNHEGKKSGTAVAERKPPLIRDDLKRTILIMHELFGSHTAGSWTHEALRSVLQRVAEHRGLHLDIQFQPAGGASLRRSA